MNEAIDRNGRIDTLGKHVATILLVLLALVFVYAYGKHMLFG
jgi:hypothetical protein